MPLIDHIVAKLTSLGVNADIRSNSIHINMDGVESKIRFDDEWSAAFDTFRRARSSNFDILDWTYSHNNSIELPLRRLDGDPFREDEEIAFTDTLGSSVVIGRASLFYSFAHFDSGDYDRYFKSIVKPRLERKSIIDPTRIMNRSLTLIFRRPLTVKYSAPGRRIPPSFKNVALERSRSCLLKLAVERHACYEILVPKEPRAINKLDQMIISDWTVPTIRYDQNIVNYYLVARSSPFASQSFLAYYHVLEYYFLRVSEDSLHYQLKTLLHRPDFKSHSDGLDKVISLVRKQASQDDETEMLRKVLQRFVSEDEFIVVVQALEADCGEKLYTKRRTIFGEALEISLKEGHALSNAAKVLKHIRNAIVHSSDKYNRDECHIPLTATENIIADYIPVVKYFSEQVIYGSGAPSEY